MRFFVEDSGSWREYPLLDGCRFEASQVRPYGGPDLVVKVRADLPEPIFSDMQDRRLCVTVPDSGNCYIGRLFGGSFQIGLEMERTEAPFSPIFDSNPSIPAPRPLLLRSRPIVTWTLTIADPEAMSRGRAVAEMEAIACPDREALGFLSGEPLIFADWLEERGFLGGAERIRAAHKNTADPLGEEPAVAISSESSRPDSKV